MTAMPAPPPKDRGDWQHDLDREVAWERREEELERKEGHGRHD